MTNDGFEDHQVSYESNGDHIHHHDSLSDVLFSVAQSAALARRRETPALIPGPSLAQQICISIAGSKLEITAQKKTSLIQEEYLTPVPLYYQACGTGVGYSSCIRLVFFCVAISNLFPCFFHLHPYIQSFWLKKNDFPFVM